MQKVNEYPKYLYHREYDEPRMVETREQESDLLNKGWQKAYIFKEYPKMVNGILCRTKEQEDLLLQAANSQPKVEVKKVLVGPDGVPVDSNIVPEKPKTAGIVQVPEQLEKTAPPEPVKQDTDPPAKPQYGIKNENGDQIPGHYYATWDEARAAQVDLNANAPGHKAYKLDN